MIDIGCTGRFLLLEGVILPSRPRKSAAAYRNVWMAQRSPLLIDCLAFTKALQERLADVRVESPPRAVAQRVTGMV